MSRIEMPIEEYNSLKKRIKELESSLVDVSKEASTFKEKLDNVEGLVIDLENERLIDRIFAWKDIVKPFKELFANEKTK